LINSHPGSDVLLGKYKEPEHQTNDAALGSLRKAGPKDQVSYRSFTDGTPDGGGRDLKGSPAEIVLGSDKDCGAALLGPQR
jgi:hypothetical protein